VPAWEEMEMWGHGDIMVKNTADIYPLVNIQKAIENGDS